MSKKKKQAKKNENGGENADSDGQSPDRASDYSRDAFMTNPVASATDATGFAQRIPESEFAADQLTRMLDLPNKVTEKKR